MNSRSTIANSRTWRPGGAWTFIAAVMLLWGCSAGAATITNWFKMGDFSAPEDRVLRWENLSAPYVAEDGTIVKRDPFETELTEDGYLEARIYGGTNRVTFGRAGRQVWTLAVPFDDGKYSFWELVTNSLPFQTNLVPASITLGATNLSAVGPFKQKRNGVLEFYGFAAGSGIAISNMGSTQLVFSVTGSVSTSGEIQDDDSGEEILDND